MPEQRNIQFWIRTLGIDSIYIYITANSIDLANTFFYSVCVYIILICLSVCYLNICPFLCQYANFFKFGFTHRCSYT